MAEITWTNERRKLGDLQPWPRNPRQINKDQARRLAESFDEFGQVETIAIGPEAQVYNGHQRLNVLMSKHGKGYEVEVRVASRALTEKEREKLTVFLHKGAAGEWNFDTLANEFEVVELVEWGFEEYELGIMNVVNDGDYNQRTARRLEPHNNAIVSIGQLVGFVDRQKLAEFVELIKKRYSWSDEDKEDATDLIEELITEITALFMERV